jgi:hypothetical protein
MSLPKDNPAPWTVHDHSWCDTSILDANRETVCSLSIKYDCTEETQEEWEANMAQRARLIAAAPDMLAALELALDQSWNGPLPDGAREKCAAAILKAKGEA